MADGRCILVCRTCAAEADGDLLPMPFSSYLERGQWASGHTKGTGHQAWYCLDGWPSPDEVAEKMAESAAFAARLRELQARARAAWGHPGK